VDIGQLHVALKSVCRIDHAIDRASPMTTMRMRVIRVDTLIAWSAIAHFVAEGMRFVGIFWKAIFVVSQIVGSTILSYFKKISLHRRKSVHCK
jgi:hypothetical protein